MKKLLIPLIAAGSLLYLPASHAEDPAKLLCAWRASSPAIAAEASVTVLKLLSSISLKRTSTAFTQPHEGCRKAFLNECPDNGEGGSNQSMISQIISKYGKVRL